jgi:hypothetical protein
MPVRGGPSTRQEVRRRVAVSVVALGALLALAAPAAAATPAAPNPRPGLCARVETQWARIVVANKRAKTAFARASALRGRLMRAGRVRLAHRLDLRLRYLRQIHRILVDRVALLAARAGGVCPGRPPVLGSY